MTQLRFPRPMRALPELRYVRAPEPLHFPEADSMPESKSHLLLRTFLFRLLQFAPTPEHSVGSEQFIYWNASDPKRVLAPDAFVKLGVLDTPVSHLEDVGAGGRAGARRRDLQPERRRQRRVGAQARPGITSSG